MIFCKQANKQRLFGNYFYIYITKCDYALFKYHLLSPAVAPLHREVCAMD